MRRSAVVTTTMCVAAVLAGAGPPLGSQERLPLPPGRAMLIGVDYYPEHWPRERWETDIKLMKEAGFNTVRLAEFAWVEMEPREGQFEFGWLEDAGIRPVISVPAGVEASLRQKQDRRLLFLINHTEQPQTIEVPRDRVELLTGRKTGESLQLQRFDVAVIELERI